MAIYSLGSRILGRSQGHTSVGYAAYLAAEKFYDERYDTTRNFDKKPQRDRIHHLEIVAPEDAPGWVYNREKLWNKNEQAERRKDSQVAREIRIALPVELSHSEKVAVGLKFVCQEYAKKGMVADVSFHNFDGEGSHNPHAHILLTTRRLQGDGFAPKKEESWRPPIVKDPRTGKAIVDPEFLKEERKTWERYCNDALRQAGHDQRVDCRSYKDRGIDRAPQPKRGKTRYMEQREAWQQQTRAGDAWREAQHLNALKDEQKNLAREQQEVAQEIRVESVKQAFEIGQELAREAQAPHRQRETQPPPSKAQPKPFREPWQREWEKEHDAARKRRNQGQRARDRRESIQRREQEQRTLKNQQHSEAAQSLATPDERHIIEQWRQYHDRERDKPRSVHDRHQGKEPERGVTEEQQMAKLREEMAAFEAEQQDKSSHKPEPGRGFKR